MFAPTTLTKVIRNALTLPVEITPAEEGMRTAKYNNLTWHWDNALGFQDFVKERFFQFKNYKGHVFDAETVIKNIRKFDARPAPGSKTWPGWLAWKEVHPELCTVVQQEEEPVKPARIYIED